MAATSGPAEIHDDLERPPGSPPRRPGWVKAFLIIAVVLLVVLVVGLFTGQLGPGGGHGLGRHVPEGNSVEQRP
jgi:hypothetical protein